MNLRETLGAIPLFGTLVGAITIIKTKINEHLSPTDHKIRKILSSQGTFSEKTVQIQELLGKKPAPTNIPYDISTEGKTSNNIYNYYQTLIREQSINKQNAIRELIPFFGTFHHLLRTHLHNWRGSRTSVDVKAAIRTLKILGRPEDVALVQKAYEDLKAAPSRPGTPNPAHNTAKETIYSLIGFLIQPREMTDESIDVAINKGFKLNMITKSEEQELRDAWKDYQTNPSQEARLKIHRMMDFCCRTYELSLPDWYQKFSDRIEKEYRLKNQK